MTRERRNVDDHEEGGSERTDQLEIIAALPDPDLEVHPYPELDELKCTSADEFYTHNSTQCEVDVEWRRDSEDVGTEQA